MLGSESPPGPSPDAGGVEAPAPSPSGFRRVERLSLVSVERSLARAHVAGLEAALSEVTPERVHRWFDSDPGILEVALLRTCQRVLLLAVTEGRSATERWIERLGPRGSWEVRVDSEAILHLHEVTAGLGSRASGEREIRDQVRAVATNISSRSPRPILRTLLRGALRAAERSEGTETTSVADLAAEWLRPRLPARSPRVVVIGSGVVGRKVAERLAPDARVTILYRHRAPEARWTERWGVRAVPSAEMPAELLGADAVVAAAKSTGRVLSAEGLPAVPRSGPRWFVDLGVPRNIDPEIGTRPGIELVDLDGLPRTALPERRLLVLRREIEAAAESGTADLARFAVEPWVAELRRRGEEVRREELARALGHAGPLSNEARTAIERLSLRLARRLLAGPTAQLRTLPPDPGSDRLRHRVLEILREPDPGS